MILALILAAIALRLLLTPFRRRRFYYANPYRFGCRRHHGLLGRVLPIVALIAIDRLFGPRF